MDLGKLARRANRGGAADAAAQAEFNEKRRVWIPDTAQGFLAGWVKSQSGSDADPTSMAEVVVASSGEVRTIPLNQLSPMNPPQFDGVEDIADLTHLNEASVIENLRLRYGAASIYTYSGLFLISLNPYRPLPIYTSQIIAQYRTKRREENPPHIFAVAERAWQQIGEERESQSILITGESGAGKTENTKKVIQYLAAIASSSSSSSHSSDASSSSASLVRSKSASKVPATGLPRSSSFKGQEVQDPSSSGTLGLLEQQILQANPILEAFGNAQTMRNNNSSRFGKFIRIFFSPDGAIAGANIDWYLLEKSRVTKRASGERSFHVFYQLLKGAKEARLSDKLLLEGTPASYDFLKGTRLEIDGVNDLAEWRLLKEALDVVGFSAAEQLELFRIPALILHIGNLALAASSADQAFLPPTSQAAADKICHLLGIPVKDFTKTVLSPRVRAGREWVTQARSKKQAEDELGALCKYMYEKTFGWMVERINTALDRPSAKALSIGVLDIAGFEIFPENSYEQLLINFTNEKLQQFFNFHMFTLEQEEYAREGIEWDYVNFGLDLQPTIELIESSNPIGILSCLDEECIMPKATDLTFTEKVQQLWEPPRGVAPTHPGSNKLRHIRFGKGFVIKHYAGDVEYTTAGWLEKNKDPINEALAKLLSQSDVQSIASLFAEYAEDTSSQVGVVKRVKRGAFRTVGQRHKEELGQLIAQLSATQPHFVRCIVPNGQKKPGQVDANLVLDQLRCNGVLEGIRIARLGYPNRHSFAEFRQRYEVLTPGVLPKGYMDGRQAAGKIVEALELEKTLYKVGATKIFFKAGVLADLEERRDNLLTDLFKRFQSAARMHIARRRLLKLVNRAEAIRTIQRNARVYIELRDWPWWSLYTKVRPLLGATKVGDELVKKQAELAMAKERAERDAAEKQKLEDLRAALVAEKAKVESDLSSERQIGQDKDRMLERSKANESELQERIRELETTLTGIDREREAAVLAAETAKQQLVQVQHDFEQLLEQATLLEKESDSYRAREADLLKESKGRMATQAKLEKERADLEQVVEQLKADVDRKEGEAKRNKERHEMALKELEKRLQLEKGKSDSVNTERAALGDELQKLQVKHDEALQQIKSLQASVTARQRDIADLERQRAESTKAKEASDQVAAGLRVKLDHLQQELLAKEKERDSEVTQRRQLEKALDELRQAMAAKTSEDAKRDQAEKSRGSELARLRDEKSQLQQQLQAQNDSAQALAGRLRTEFEGLKAKHIASDRDLRAAQETLKAKDAELVRVKDELAKADTVRRGIDAELANVRQQLKATDDKLNAVSVARDQAERLMQEERSKYEDLEDAVLIIEQEKSEWMSRMEKTGRQLVDESAKRQHFEQELHNSQIELAEHRNTALHAERELAKAAGEIKARDAEIALLRSRENKTIVEHVHVLEKAKKMTDLQLANQVAECQRLNSLLKQNEATRIRQQGDIEDMQRQMEVLRSSKSREARQARASLSPEEKEATMALEDERRARKAAEAKIASLEIDVADLKRQRSSVAISQSTHGSVRGLPTPDQRLARLEAENARLRQAHDAAVAQSQRLAAELADAHKVPIPPSTPSKSSATRAELLRGLQQSHDALGRDMSDQLRKLDAQPLTPSRRHNASLSNGTMHSPDLMAIKRIRSLETEINGLRQQLDDERDEKEFLLERVTDLERGSTADGKAPSNFEQAMYSHFRLKAKSLRSQLDHWLAMEDLNQNNPRLAAGQSGVPFAEDVHRLKDLLAHFDPETSPLRPIAASTPVRR